MYRWTPSVANMLSAEKFLDSASIVFDRSSCRPYRIQFVTRCGDKALLMTTHKEKEQRKIRCFSTRSAVTRYLKTKLPGCMAILKDDGNLNED